MTDQNTIAANDITPWNELTTTSRTSCATLARPNLPPIGL